VDDLPLIDIAQIGSNLVHLTIAYVLALPIAWERERHDQSAGLRTFPLVAMASCGYVLLTSRMFAGSPEAQARIVEGLITGIGFIGGGAILKGDEAVRGTATAASIWNTGAIGAAVAYGRYEIALLLAVINFVTLRWLARLKPSAKQG
jgi:putative Mg2+ transporter-C (MgtC) family protein